MDLIDRHLGGPLRDALGSFRVVVLHGARQCGKTTLARAVVEERGGTYVTLDDDAVRAAALADPLTFLTTQPLPLAIDEIQLGGDRLIRTVKQVVDADPEPGRYLLTGSTNFLTVPVFSESLAGRVRILRLWPLSQSEIAGSRSSIASWFDEGAPPPSHAPMLRAQYLERVCRGGYPEVVMLAERARHGWFESYIETVTQRDIAALADIRKVSSLQQLLRWVAGSTSRELNVSAAARDLGIARPTITSYLEWLQTVFFVHEIPAWSRSISGSALRRPKVHLTDTGLAADLLAATPATLTPATSTATGPLIESFVVGEIARQLSAADTRIELSHHRDNDGREVDLILERGDGAVMAIEIKTTSSPTASQLHHVAWLRDKLDAVAPGTFTAGYLLHTGVQSLTVGDRLHLVPIEALWARRDASPG